MGGGESQAEDRRVSLALNVGRVTTMFCTTRRGPRLVPHSILIVTEASVVAEELTALRV